MAKLFQPPKLTADEMVQFKRLLGYAHSRMEDIRDACPSDSILSRLDEAEPLLKQLTVWIVEQTAEESV